MIGPGRLVLVVGPSGAGKDTLLARARALCRDNPTIRFARRVVTRPPSEAEDHDNLDEAAFAEAKAAGAFAFWWQAHGHHYGIPCSVDDEIRAGCTVVCNVSRATVPKLRTVYENTSVILVTAPAETLLKRLAARSRATDGTAEQRLARNDAFVKFDADDVIKNCGSVESGAARLLEIIGGNATAKSPAADDQVRR